MTATWTPTLLQVAACIPSRTVNQSDPGSDRHLNTFTVDTVPTAVQAQVRIDSAVESVINAVSTLPTLLESAAHSAATWRAAADIELVYPDRTADIDIYTKLNERAEKEWKLFLEKAESVGGSSEAVNPAWYMPDPVSWGDTDL
jgi:hypothetical protein